MHFTIDHLATSATFLKNFGAFRDPGSWMDQDESWLTEVLIYMEEDKAIKQSQRTDGEFYG